MNLFPKGYKPKKFTVVFHEKYIEYDSDGDEQLSIKGIPGKD